MFENGFFNPKSFQPIEKIGQGGFGEVYKIRDKRTGKIYAAKISTKYIDQNSVQDMINLSREVNNISKLQHPTILQFFGYSSVDFSNESRPMIITEYASIGSLGRAIELERRGLSIPGWDDTKKLIVIYGIAAGMQFLHSQNILHRDLKPENILLNEYLCPKIADFGLSKVSKESISASISMTTDLLYSTNGLKGTPIYIAPEVWETNESTKKSDVYAFSLIVYEIISAQIPFKKFSINQLAQKVVNDGYRPEFDFPIGLAYQKLIEGCWSQIPSQRPSFDQIVAVLRSDADFITETVEAVDYYDYIDFIDRSKKEFDSKKKIIHLSEIVNTKSKTFQKVKSDIFSSYSVIIESTIFYPHEEFRLLKKDCQKLVQKAENNSENQFFVGRNLFEGINGFPQNSELAIKYLKRSLKGGCISSAKYYSRILLDGKSLPKNPQKAAKYLQIYLETKDATVYTLYGRAKKEERDYNEAIRYFIKAANAGNPEAMHEYGLMLQNGEGVEKDKIKANEYFEMAKNNGYGEHQPLKHEKMKRTKSVKSSLFDKLPDSAQSSVLDAENGDENSMLYVARCFIEGSNNFPQNVEVGIKFLENACKKKNVEAMKFYGTLLLNGSIIKKDEEKAIFMLNEVATILHSSEGKFQLVKILLSHESFNTHDINANKNVNYVLAKKFCKEAADAGNVKAMVCYAKLCLKEKKNKFGQINCDFNEAFQYFKKAADEGDGEAMVQCGLFHEFGYGMFQKDPTEAAKYYKASYKKGDLCGLAQFGVFLIEGLGGIQKNINKGIRLIKYSCDHNNVYGMNMYAYYLLDGLPGLEKNEELAFRYFKISADLGFAISFLNLGVCYRDGKGTKMDRKEAIKCFKIGTEEGSPSAAYRLALMLIKGDETLGIKPDLKEGNKYLKFAADHGNTSAMFQYSYNIVKKRGDASQLKKYLEMGIYFKDTNCMMLYGEILMKGNMLPRNVNEGVNYIKMAADLGNKYAMMKYASLLESGEGVDLNLEEANRYKEMAT